MTEALEARVQIFKDEFPESDELLIVMYGGHGTAVDHFKRLLIGSQKSKQQADWNRVQDSCLFLGPKDVLVVLDCCYAGAAGRDLFRARKDILAACDAKSKTPYQQLIKENGSFTCLFQAAILRFQQPFTIEQLVANIAARAPRGVPYYDYKRYTLARSRPKQVLLFLATRASTRVLEHRIGDSAASLTFRLNS